MINSQQFHAGERLKEILDNPRRKAIVDQCAKIDPATLGEVRRIEQLASSTSDGPPLSRDKTKEETPALLDSVTDLYNYDALITELKNEIIRCKRYQRPMTLGIVCIDGFKQMTSELGQLTSDALINAVVKVLKRSVRESDICARYDNDHLAVIFPQAAIWSAAVLAESVRHKIGTQAITHNWRNLKITSSIGLASFPMHAQEHDELIAAAINAAELVLARGGDRVCIA